MNILLVIGLAVFIGTIFWLYFIFITNTITEIKKEVKAPEPVYDNVLERSVPSKQRQQLSHPGD